MNEINNWLEINKYTHFLKKLNIWQLMINIVLSFFCLTLYNRSPVVALVGKTDTHFLPAKKSSAPLQKGTLKRHIEKFVKGRYEWEKFSIVLIVKNISPLVTEGFQKRLLAELKEMKGQFQEKKLNQAIAGLKIIVTKEKTMAIFDRILRIDGIPLIIPTELSFKLVQGQASQFNPSGLEINGVLIHEKT